MLVSSVWSLAQRHDRPPTRRSFLLRPTSLSKRRGDLQRVMIREGGYPSRAMFALLTGVIPPGRVSCPVASLALQRQESLSVRGRNVVRPVAKLPHGSDSEDQVARLTRKALTRHSGVQGLLGPEGDGIGGGGALGPLSYASQCRSFLPTTIESWLLLKLRRFRKATRLCRTKGITRQRRAGRLRSCCERNHLPAHCARRQ